MHMFLEPKYGSAPHLITHTLDSNTFPLCSLTDVDLSRTAHDLQNIAQKDVISTMDLENATSMVDKALQVGALLEPNSCMLLAAYFITYQQCKSSA
jgi:hypothetical protein